MTKYRMSSLRHHLFFSGILISVAGALLYAEIEAPADPVRDMLLAHYESVEKGYRNLISGLSLPLELGLTAQDLNTALDSLHHALSEWKIEFRPSYAAFAVQTATHLLVVNPQSMPHILENDDDVLLHESVHVAKDQVARQLYGLHAELVFFEWIQEHVDEDKAAKAEERLRHSLTPDNVLRLKLWAEPLSVSSGPWKNAANALRASWICEIQAYYVQMLAFNRQLQAQGALPLDRTAEMLRKTFASELAAKPYSAQSTESPLTMKEDDIALNVFQSFRATSVSPGFQDAVLACVLMDTHKGLLFKTLTEAGGWDLRKANADTAYRRQLFRWARAKILRWKSLRTESTALSESEREDLRQNGLLTQAARSD